MNAVRRTLISTSLLLALICSVAACGLSGELVVTNYRDGELPEALTATTSTTVNVPPTSLPPDSSVGSTTSMVPPVQVAAVNLYYVIPGSENLQRLILNLPEPVTVAQVVSQLERPTSDVFAFNLQTAVRFGLIESLVLDRGTATVGLRHELLAVMSDTQTRNAIAQIVLTLTSFVTSTEGAIGQVTFTLDGAPISVYLPSSGTNSEPGTPVAYVDFAAAVIGTDTPP